jgi:hypothetical protein
MSTPLTPEQRLALSRERIRLALQEPAWGGLLRWLLARAAK